MTVKTLPTPDFFETQVASLISGYNQLNQALADHGLLPHHVATAKVTDTGTADLSAVLVLANALKAAYNAHIADTSAHPAADATNPTTAAAATDQTTANTLLNELKSDFNAHIVLRASHRAAPVAAEFAKDLETLKTSYGLALAHLDADTGVNSTDYAATFGAAVAVNPAIVKTADASDLATSKTLAAALLIAMNRHFGAGAPKIVSTGT